jgi:hypothetical protein
VEVIEMATATLLSDSLTGWAPGTRHYSTSDGKHLAVEADPTPEGTIIPAEELPLLGEILVRLGGEHRNAVSYVVRETAVFLCDKDGQPVDADENDHDPLTPLHVFPAGTTHEAALKAAGYKIRRSLKEK